MCFEFFVNERCLKKREKKGRPNDLCLSHDFGIEKASAPAELTLCFSCMWKHIHIFSEATTCPSPVHFIMSWHLSNWARWKTFPTLGSLSTCQLFNFTVLVRMLIRLQNVLVNSVHFIPVEEGSSLFLGQPSFGTFTFPLSSPVQKLFVIVYTPSPFYLNHIFNKSRNRVNKTTFISSRLSRWSYLASNWKSVSLYLTKTIWKIHC